MNVLSEDRIEILSVRLLDTERMLVEEMRQISEALGLGLGWHYLLDLSWATRVLDPAPGMQVMDAGAGTGVMQWWLADHGVDVMSVDRTSRRSLPIRFRQQYPVEGFREKDLAPARLGLREFLPSRAPKRWGQYPGRLASSIRQLLGHRRTHWPNKGKVLFYNQDLASMTDVPDSSVDAVVSISALEHNSSDGLWACVAELMRVLRPGGRLIATLGAAKDQDWFHEPSKGWCYTEATLRDIFDLSDDCPSNYEHHDDLFEALRDCAELRDSLTDSYFGSGNNGMPWGKWDPKYQPVGVCKVKK